MDAFTQALNAAERAELRARKLKEEFGDGADRRCAEEIASFDPSDPRRQRVVLVRKALRWI